MKAITNGQSTSRFMAADGRTLVIRPIRRRDAELLRSLHRRHSAETRRMRFFSAKPELGTALARQLAEVDFDRRAAFVACYEGEEAIRAVARYAAVDGETAEIAFVIEDNLQGQGLGSALFRVLAEHAVSRGFRNLTALTLAENRPMLRLFEKNAEIIDITRDGTALRVLMRAMPAAA